MQSVLNLLVTLMVGIFLFSLVNSLAQRYHKRRHTQQVEPINKNNVIIKSSTSKNKKLKTK